MGEKSRPGTEFTVNIRKTKSREDSINTKEDETFNLVVLGDLSGRFDRSNPPDKSLAERKPICIDRDNFDDVFRRFQPSVSLSLNSGSQADFSIDFSELDDFEPDVLYHRLEIFSRLRGIRQGLQNKETFDRAAQEIMGWLVESSPEAQGSEAEERVVKEDKADTIPPDDLLQTVLTSTQQPATELESVLQSGGVDRLVKEVIAPYVEPAPNPRQQEMVDAVDNAIAGLMRQILHYPNFQALEATWRSLYFLLRRVENDRKVKIYLLDVTKQELNDDLSGDASASALHKLFCEPVLNDISWGLMLGNYYFEDRIEDVLLLAQLGEIARCAEAPFIAGARETIVGCQSFSLSADADDWKYQVKAGFEQAWTMLRESDVAEYIGLVLPRFLLRVPYGDKSKPIESFSFEEFAKGQADLHAQHLWGNGAYIKAEQLVRAFSAGGWHLLSSDLLPSAGMPTYYYDQEGETVMKPCAEIYLTEKGGRRLLSQGLIALWSVKNQDVVLSNDFHSLAEPTVPLRGRWVASTLT